MQRGLAGHRVVVRMARALRGIEARGGSTRWRPPERIHERGRNPAYTRPVDDVGNYSLSLSRSLFGSTSVPFQSLNLSMFAFLFLSNKLLSLSLFFSCVVWPRLALVPRANSREHVAFTSRQNLYKAMRECI